MPARTAERVEHVQLRRAVKNRAFSLHYQPLIDADSGQVTAVEALLRCSDPFFANYPIEKLLEMAAETGRLRRLGLWVLAEASRKTRQWQLEGWRGLGLVVNFCRIELVDAKFAQRVAAAAGAGPTCRHRSWRSTFPSRS